MDNIICFWNSFNGVESKKIILPEEIADLAKGQTVQYVRFPFEDKKDLLMVIINNGDCFILETQSEKFIEFNNYLHKSGSIEENVGVSDLESMNSIIIDEGADSIHRSSIDAARSSIDSAPSGQASNKKVAIVPIKTVSKYLLGRISTYPTVDLCEGYLVSLSENGKGMLFSLKRNVEKKQAWRNKQEFKMKDLDLNPITQNPVSFEELHKFKVSEAPLEHSNPVFMVQIELDHGIIVAGQLKGQVTIMQLSTCEILGVLN